MDKKKRNFDYLLKTLGRKAEVVLSKKNKKTAQKITSLLHVLGMQTLQEAFNEALHKLPWNLTYLQPYNDKDSHNFEELKEKTF